MDVKEAIKRAEMLLPGEPSQEGHLDPRWQAIIIIAEYIQAEPETVWSFIRTWGCYPQQDLKDAIATCLLEHLLELYFAEYFPQIEQLALTNEEFANTLSHCWKFGQSQTKDNSFKLDELRKRLSIKL